MYSDYYYTLDTESAKRYRDKISVIGIDPYILNLAECSGNEDFPKTLYPDIVNYLLYNKSAYTHEDFKVYKGLEAYKQATCGWVKRVAVKKIDKYILVLGKVMHSQKLNDQLLKPWIITKDDGSVLYAHCNCMAGLGEACTHISAVLFYIDITNRRSEISPTDVKAYWVAPSKPSEPKRVVDINFAVPSTSKAVNDTPVFVREESSTKIPSLNKDELVSVLTTLKETERGCVLHTVIPPFSKELTEMQAENRQYILSNLYKLEYEQESVQKLIEIGSHLDLRISIDVCKEIERETNKQANSRAWFNFRAGRITASKFKAVCRTKLEKPSLSLIKSICYPSSTKIKTKATIYGCEHEKDALKNYSAKMEESHISFGADPVGLCINPEYPHFGASPDGLVSCDCCGLGCVEIKCPYCAKDLDLEDLQVLKKVGIEEVDGKMQLNENHAYYYQVQMQLGITKLAYCDFVVWNKNKFMMERIYLNESFWNKESKVASEFFYKVILPELLGKFYTKSIDSNPSNEWSIEETGTE